jgi:hypothetical protein
VNVDRSAREGLHLFPSAPNADERYKGWFHSLDAWTEYWDVFHPESRGRYYFGDGATEPGLLRQFLPRDDHPPAFIAWNAMALGLEDRARFVAEVRRPEVAEAVMEVDALLGRLFDAHFGDAEDPAVQADYLEATFRFAIDTLPPAPERDARIAPDDPRKKTAGRHRLEGDLMWFIWALAIEASHAIAGGGDPGYARRVLQLAGVAAGCPADFAWRGHRRTRPEYAPQPDTVALLRERSSGWLRDLQVAAHEVHALYRFREWGHDGS